MEPMTQNDLPVRLSKDEAMEKWGHYTDSAIRSSGLSLEKQMESLVAAGATEDSLKAFWLEVKHFRWPGSYGQSPWDIASCLGAALEARDLGPAFRAVGMRYVEPFREAFLKAAPNVQGGATLVEAILSDILREDAVAAERLAQKIPAPR